MTSADRFERQMLDLINAERAAVGAKPLTLELNLNQSSENHSNWMLRTDIFSHTGVGGSSATDRMVDAGFDLKPGWGTGENIAVQTLRGAAGITDDVVDLHESLMNSPGHRANILNPSFTHLGLGIEVGGYDYGNGERTSVIVTQNFAFTQGTLDEDKGAGGTPKGTAGDDVLTGGSGADKMIGFQGDDRIEGRGGNDSLYGRNDNDALTGGDGGDKLYGGKGADKLYGNAGNDRVDGGKGNDVVYGGDGRDIVVGGSGTDKLYGGKSDDVLRGGGGRDQLWGGDGADTFVFRPGDGKDIVRDYNSAADRIDLRAFDFANAARAMDKAVKDGGDVVFKFGDGDTLTLEDTSLRAVSDDLMI